MSTKLLNQEIENIDSDLTELSKLEHLCQRDTIRSQLTVEVNRLTLRRNQLVQKLRDTSGGHHINDTDQSSPHKRGDGSTASDDDKEDEDLSSGISKMMDGNSDSEDKDKSLLSTTTHSLSPSSIKEEGYGSEEKSEHTPSSTTSHQTFSRFSRGSGRLSMVGNQLDVWCDAADRQVTRSINRKSEQRIAAKEMYKNYNSLPKHMSYNSATKTKASVSSSISSEDIIRHRDYTDTEDNDKSSVILILAKESGPLGIHVVPESDEIGYANGLLIQGIEPGGRIDRDGRLHVGDAIVEINGQSILDKDFETSQLIFKSALQTDEITLRLVKYNQNVNQNQSVTSVKKSCAPPVLPKPTNVMRQHEQLRLVEGMVEGEERAVQTTKVANVTSTKKLTPTITAPKPAIGSSVIGVANTRRIGKKYHIQLKKGPEGLGFSITTRDNPTGGNVPIYIKNILSNGAAVEDGRLKPGDRLLEVCGIEMTGKSQTEAVNILRTLPLGTSVDLIVSRQEVDSSPSPMMPRRLPPEKSTDTSGNEREVLTFEIPLNDTGSAGLGVSMKGKTTTATGVQSDLGIFVKHVIHGGAASMDGRLKTNDQLININGIPLLGMSNSQAMETLRRAMILSEGPVANPNAITVTIARKSSATTSADESLNNSSHERNDSQLSATSNNSSNEETFGVNHNNTNNETYDHSYRSTDNTVIYRPKSDVQVMGSNSKLTPQRESQIVSSPTDKTPPKTPLNSQSTSQTFLKQFYLSENHDSNRLYDKSPNIMSRSDVIIERDCEENELPVRGSGVRGDGRDRNESLSESAPRDSQLSLNDENDDGFRRDGFGRQSMSEKRHAQLDAKSTDTYRRSKKVKEEKERQVREAQQLAEHQQHYRNHQSVNGVQHIPQPSQQPVNTEPKVVVPHEIGKCRSPGSCPYHTVHPNATQLNRHTAKDMGPALGMRKSSSLESLQTMMQDIQKEQLESANPFTTPRHSTVRVSRNRETNDGFRPEMNYNGDNIGDNIETMQTVAEDDSDSGSSIENMPRRPHTHRPNIHHTQAILVRPSGGALSMASTQYTATTATTEDENQAFLNKKKSSSGKKKRLLRTWFKFGSKKGRSSEAKQKVADREAAAAGQQQQTREQQMSVQNAQQLFILEQERIHMHYKRLQLQQQQLQQQQSHVSHTAQPTPPARQRSKSAVGERFGSGTDRQLMHSTPTGITGGQLSNQELSADNVMSRNERMAQLRAQHQRMQMERQRVYPTEARIYDTYSSMDRKQQSDIYNTPTQLNSPSTQIYASYYPNNPNYPPSPRRLVFSPKCQNNAFERRAASLRSNNTNTPLKHSSGADVQHSRGNSYDIYRQAMERPGSRVGIAGNNKYGHYMNYREIQQQMHNYHQQQQQNVNHYSDYEIYVPPIDEVPAGASPAGESGQRPMMRTKPQQTHQRQMSSPVGHRPQPERPNYYEYETAAAVLQAKQQLIQQQNNANNNHGSPQKNISSSSLPHRPKKYTKQADNHTPTGTSIQVPLVRQQPQPIYQTNQLKIYGSSYANGYSQPPSLPTNPPPSHRIYDTLNANNTTINANHDSNGYGIAGSKPYPNPRPGSKV